MQIPDFMRTVGFWVKFVPIFLIFVIVPIFYMDFTNSLGWGRRILFIIGGAFGVALALNGKTIGKKHGFGGRR